MRNSKKKCNLVFFFLLYFYNSDLNRLWIRNLSRDDRVISENGKEVRYPFLDADLIKQV